MNASELKYHYQAHNPDGHFFDRKTMRFFGDTMRNFGVRSKPVKIRRHSGDLVTCYELYRRRPVKHGLQSSHFFSIDQFEIVHGGIEQ